MNEKHDDDDDDKTSRIMVGYWFELG